MKAYPIKLEPIYKERIWGGQKLAEYFGKALPANTKIGESWELSDLPDDKCKIINGQLAGLNINEAITKYPQMITGKDAQNPFPLLIKYLDAQDILSVQVHPDPETCKRTGKGDPKTECWYIIEAQPESYIYKGVKEGVTRESFAKAIKAGTVEELLEKVYVSKEQCHFLPAGTAHAIGAGLLIAEIQTPSDTTYRVFDFNRLNSQGNPRQLHIDDALESIRFDLTADKLPITKVGRLVDSEFFCIDKGHQAPNCELLLSPGKTQILMFLSGSGTITSPDGAQTQYKKGDTILIPYEFEGVVIFAQDCQYLKITI